MSTNYPTSLQTIPNPISTDLLENASATLDHDYQHGTVNDTVAALQAKVGINSSAVTTSHDYKLSGVTGPDKAVSKTGTETLTNKTLTAPQINLNSDATGDLIYRSSGGVTSRLAIGSSSQILQVSSGGIPEWIANPAATDGSTTVKGVFEEATSAEINAGTATGGTGARLTVTAAGLAASDYATTTEVDAVKANVQTFIADGTWTKPTGAKFVDVYAFGGGGGGGSGARNSGAPSSRDGGSGGAGGSFSYKRFLAGALASTETVDVGAGGAGGAAVSSDSVGNPGTAGSASSFGTTVLLKAPGGGQGLGGLSSGSAAGGTAVAGNGDIAQAGGTGGAGGDGGDGSQGTDTLTLVSARGGAGGASATGSAAGGNGGAFITNYVKAGGAGGASGGANSGAGGSSTDVNLIYGGVGGGGGGSGGAGGAVGGAGGSIGGGGGGGSGASTTSGAGGAGASGMIVVVTSF